VSDDGQIATITLNQPHIRNAQNPITWSALRTSVAALPGTVRVLLIRGEGPAFSAGLDRRMFSPDGLPGVPTLAALAGSEPAVADAEIAGYQQAFAALARPDLVSIALVQGHAVGAGFQLALACDLRIAAPDAQFSMAEVNLGLVPDLGGTKRLLELIGYSRAASVCLTGRRVSAAEADRIGLVSAVVPADELRSSGQQWAELICQQPRSAVAEIKALLLAAADRSQAEQEVAEREAQYRQLRELAGMVAEDEPVARQPGDGPTGSRS